MLLALAVVVVAAAEWPRITSVVGVDARRQRRRERRKAQLRVISPDPGPADDHAEFVESVRRDLDALPTIEESDRGNRRR